MLLFGVAAVSALWLYWELYTRPFRPLQYAIHAEFPKSSPQVIGGRHKSGRDGSPAVLRIVVRVDFNPLENAPRAQQLATHLAALAKRHHDLTHYQFLEVHLEQRVPEHDSHLWSLSKPVEEWFSGEGGGGDESPTPKDAG